MTSQTLITYYGDDFTGSADVMEVLSCNGISTVLFLGIPTEAHWQQFASAQAVGIAGTSRSETPQWMDKELPRYFTWLKNVGSPICHYKVCSTFDSSRHVGSIGRAIDIGSALFKQAVTPVVAAAPNMRRYTVFGNHFAAYGEKTYRIDQHPIMSVHPVTPMSEAQLAFHLADQTDKKIDLADFKLLGAENVDQQVDDLLSDGVEVLLFDMMDNATQLSVGKQLWRLRRENQIFVAGSSGIEYALLDAWKAGGMVGNSVTYDLQISEERLAIVSGSCSATTEKQIIWARQNGFEGILIDAANLVSDENGMETLDQLVQQGIDVLKRGKSVIFYSALSQTEGFVHLENKDSERFRHRLGERLGKLLVNLIEREKLKRAVIAGGDTSSHALQQLGAYALTLRMPLPATPGSPLCCVHSDVAAFDGLEVALKGGQIGNDDYFGVIRDGTFTP